MVCTVQPAIGSQPSIVQGFPSLQVGGVPGVQVPPWQVSGRCTRVAVAAVDPVHDRDVATAEHGVARVARAGFPSSQFTSIAHARATHAAFVHGAGACCRHSPYPSCSSRGRSACADSHRATCTNPPCTGCRRRSRGRAAPAVPAVAGLLAVADVAVRARGAVRLVDVLAAGSRVARVLGAGVAVVAVDGVADAGAAVAALVERALTGILALVVGGARVSAGGEEENEGEDER